LEDAVELTQQIMLLVRRWMGWQVAWGLCAKRKRTRLLHPGSTNRHKLYL